MPKSKLSKQAGKVLRQIRDELADMHIKWGQFKLLFLDEKPETAEVLNRTATYFFVVVQDCMFRDILLTLARLCDPPKTAGYDNLTFETLANELPTKLQARYLAKLKTFRKRVRKVLYWRNKNLAHNSLPHGLKQKKLPRIRYDKIPSYMKDAGKLYNMVTKYNGEKLPTIFEMSFAPRGAANLLSYLKQVHKQLDEKYSGIAKTQSPDLINPL